MTKLVKDLMRPGYIACKPHTTLGQAAVLMEQHNVHALFVEDRGRRIAGVISDLDLMAGEWLSKDAQSLATMRALTVADLMSQPVDSVEADTPIEQAADEFLKKGVARLLATQKGKPVGVISLSDFVAHIAERGQIERETVGDVMSRAILTCRASAPVVSAARAMTSAGWRSVVAVDPRGKLLGVVSGFDLLQLVKHGVSESVTVQDVMHPALTISPRASLPEAADKLLQNHYHRLLVVDEEDPDSFPLGALSTFDIVAEMARPDSVWQK